jgi:zinc transport system ATP-binding protein
MENILEVEGLGIRLGGAPILRDLTFHLPRGSTLAVIGPNGSGKTVLFRALIGAIPHEGTLRWASGTRFGYVPQKLDIERDLPLTGTDLLAARARIARLPAQDVPAALRRVGLDEDVAARPIGALSGGQFRLVLCALALLGNPNVLLFDEPTAGVDESGQERLQGVLGAIRGEEQATALVISHELSVVVGYATHVLCLGRKTVSFGAPREVITPEMLDELYGTHVSFDVHDGH